MLQKSSGHQAHFHLASMGQESSKTTLAIDEKKEVKGRSSTTSSSMIQLDSNAVATEQELECENGSVKGNSKGDRQPQANSLKASLLSLGEVSERKGESSNSSDPNILSYLGLVKTGTERNLSQETVAEPGEKSKQEAQLTDFSIQKSKQISLTVPKPIKVILDVPVKLSERSRVRRSTVADNTVSHIFGGSSGIRNSDNDQSVRQSSSNTPTCTRMKDDQKEETIICCPVSLLLQHKDHVHVTLQADNQDVYSITCRKCSHEVDKPYAMLQHLKEEHQIQGYLEKLLNLNNRHLGCMSRPECINISGVPTLPEGLSDMDKGVTRFNDVGVSRLSFVCRICPLNFNTARGLSAHHQYFTRCMQTKDRQDPYHSNFTCKICPRQFVNFIDFYAHHKWMRIAKDLFLQQKVDILNDSGQVVASVNYPSTLAVNNMHGSDTESIDDLGWGHKSNPSTDKSVQGYVLQCFTETASGTPDSNSQNLSANTRETSGTLSPKQLSEVDQGNLTHLQFQSGETPSTFLKNKPRQEGVEEQEAAKFMCGICHKTFPRLVQMQGHMGSHAKQHRPDFSSTTPWDKSAIEKPNTREPRDIEYKCGICSEVFPKLKLMQTHIESHCKSCIEPQSQPVPGQADTSSSESVRKVAISEIVRLISFACDICHKTFLSELKLWDHRRTHITNEKAAAEGDIVVPACGSVSFAKKKEYFCIACNKSYCHKKSLIFHSKGHCKNKLHKNASNKSKQLVEQSKTLLQTGWQTKNKVVDAHYQDLKNTSNRHREQVENPTLKVRIITAPASTVSRPPHICNGCGKSFNLLWQLRRHKGQLSKTGKFGIRQDADMALLTSTQEGLITKQSHVCNICRKNFRCFWQLRCHKGKRHIRANNSLQKVAVGDSKTVGTGSLVQRASNIEKSGGSNTDSCDSKIKGKTAKFKNRLRSLIAWRTRGKVYQTRAQKNKLQSNKVNTLQYKCNICKRSFAEKLSLRSHQLIHRKKREIRTKVRDSLVKKMQSGLDRTRKQISAQETRGDNEVCDNPNTEDSSLVPDHEDSVSREKAIQLNAHSIVSGNSVAVMIVNQVTKPNDPDLRRSDIKSDSKALEKKPCDKTKSLSSGKNLSNITKLQFSRISESDNTQPQSSQKNPTDKTEPHSSGKSQSDKTEPQSSRKGQSNRIEPQFSWKSTKDKSEPQSSGESEGDKIEPRSFWKNPSEKIEPQSSRKNLSDKTEPQSPGKRLSDKIEPQSSGKNPSDKDVLQSSGRYLSDKTEPQKCSSDKTTSQHSAINTSENINPKLSETKSSSDNNDWQSSGQCGRDIVYLQSVGKSHNTRTDPKSSKRNPSEDTQNFEKSPCDKTEIQSLGKSPCNLTNSNSGKSLDDETDSKPSEMNPIEKIDPHYLVNTQSGTMDLQTSEGSPSPLFSQHSKWHHGSPDFRGKPK